MLTDFKKIFKGNSTVNL